MKKVVPADVAIAGIRDGSTIGIAGFRWAGAPELLLRTLGTRFRNTGSPRKLTLIFSSAQGDSAGMGLENLAQRGLVARAIGGFWGISPNLSSLAQTDEIEAYNFPQGQICRLYGAIAAGLPGLLSRIGLDSFVDPRSGGGKLNALTKRDLVELVQLRGQDWLLYHSLPIDVALIRGTSADEFGNVSFEQEAVTTEALNLAFAAHNSGGRVIVQVRQIVESKSIGPHHVAVPGHVVDHVVVADDASTEHRQCVQSVYNPAFTSAQDLAEHPKGNAISLIRHIVAHRAMQELREGDVVNLGQGIPTDIVGLLDSHPARPYVTFTLESGVVGGRPQPAPDFGIATGPNAILRQDDQFTFYNGGGLDAAFLGFAEIDASGSVNVSRFGGRLVGCGGFLDIAQTAKRLIFCGTLTAGGLELALDGSHLRVRKEGRTRKFLSQLTERTFGTDASIKADRPIVYVTERCVFSLTRDGLRLDEVAPGVDIQNDILDQMDFVPKIAPQLKRMPIPEMRS